MLRRLFSFFVGGQTVPAEALKMAEQLVEGLIAKHPVMVFSKTYCPFCTKAKKVSLFLFLFFPFFSLVAESSSIISFQALTGAGAKFELMELESRDDCDAIQVWFFCHSCLVGSFHNKE